MSTKRFVMQEAAPEMYKAMFGLERSLASSDLSKTHRELIKIRASQINGCAFCINMHTRDARQNGETEQRIYLLDAWRETELYTPEERVILALTEEVTLIQQQVSDKTYREAVELLGESYTAQVIMATVTINAWNRIAISTLLPLDE